MNVTGIIAEYNPFHKGHLYQLSTLPKSDDNYIIVIMSGDFVQRGTPAILDKWTRAKMALSQGVDLVIELPAVFATASAQYFAGGGVSVLDKLGVVNHLCFGCESDSAALLTKTADYLSKEPSEYKKELTSYIKEGNSFPKARELALQKMLGDEVIPLISSPNNILALEYCIALSERNSSILPLPVKRTGSGYHEEDLQTSLFPSATAIRSTLSEGVREGDAISAPTAQNLKEYLPSEVYDILSVNKEKLLLSQNALSLLLKYKLLSCKNPLDTYADITPDLAGKIRNKLNQYETFSQFADILKSKDLTHARITRGLTHILLDITQDMYASVKENDYANYARVLGFRKRALPLLSEIGKNTSIPLITKLADARSLLSEQNYTFLEHDIFCSHVYESVVADKTGKPFQNEFTRQIIIIK